jgi:hypothetical protein
MESDDGKKAFNTLENRRRYVYIALFVFEVLFYGAITVGFIPPYSTVYIFHAIASDFLMIIGLLYSYSSLTILLKKNHPTRHTEIKK